jgi:hypothetical protein
MFDFTNDEAKGNFEVLPKGDYLVACTEAEVKTTKDGSGTFIKAQFTVKAGPYEARKIFQNFNLTNRNEKAVQIGRGQIKGFLLAAGATNFKLDNVTDLCGKIAIAKVDIEESTQYGDKNKITSFKPVSRENATVHSSMNSSSKEKTANPFA